MDRECLNLIALVGLLLAGAAAPPDPPSREAIVNAPRLTEERIDVVTETATCQGPLYAPRPQGDGYLLLFFFLNYGEPAPAEAVCIDSVTQRVQRFTIRRGLNVSLSLGRSVATPDGKRFFHFGRLWAPDLPNNKGELWCFDPEEPKVFGCGSPPNDLLGSGYNRLAVDAAGRVYGTTTKQGRVGLYSYDPASGKFHSYGLVSPPYDRGGETHGYYLMVLGDYAYIACGKVPWRLVAFNMKTGRSEVILEAKAGNAQIFFMDDVAVRRPDPGDPNRMEMYELESGKAVLRDKAWSFGKLAARRKEKSKGQVKAALPQRPKLWTGGMKPTPDGKARLWMQRPGENEWLHIDFKVNTYPKAIRRLSALPDGRLFGTPGSYEGNFMYDPTTGKHEWLGRLRLSHYATAIHDGKIYMSGYPSSPVFEYDPAKPWTAGQVEFGKRPPKADDPGLNPRQVCLLRESWCHKMWGAAVGSDGCIYFSGEVARQGNGGGMGWWDPKAEESGALDWKQFAGQKLLYMCRANGGDRLVMSSNTTVNNLTGKTPESAKLFVFDVKTRKITASYEPIPGAAMLGPMVEVSPGKLMGVASGGRYRDEDRNDILYGFDLDSGNVTFRLTIPAFFCCFNHGIRGGQEFLLGPDGWVWTLVGPEQHPHYPTLIRIHPQTAAIRIVGRVERRGPMVFSGRDLYRGCEHKKGELKMRRLAGIVPEP